MVAAECRVEILWRKVQGVVCLVWRSVLVDGDDGIDDVVRLSRWFPGHLYPKGLLWSCRQQCSRLQVRSTCSMMLLAKQRLRHHVVDLATGRNDKRHTTRNKLFLHPVRASQHHRSAARNTVCSLFSPTFTAHMGSMELSCACKCGSSAQAFVEMAGEHHFPCTSLLTMISMILGIFWLTSRCQQCLSL